MKVGRASTDVSAFFPARGENVIFRLKVGRAFARVWVTFLSFRMIPIVISSLASGIQETPNFGMTKTGILNMLALTMREFTFSGEQLNPGLPFSFPTSQLRDDKYWTMHIPPEQTEASPTYPGDILKE